MFSFRKDSFGMLSAGRLDSSILYLSPVKARTLARTSGFIIRFFTSAENRTRTACLDMTGYDWLWLTMTGYDLSTAEIHCAFHFATARRSFSLSVYNHRSHPPSRTFYIICVFLYHVPSRPKILCIKNRWFTGRPNYLEIVYNNLARFNGSRHVQVSDNGCNPKVSLKIY